MKTGTGKARIEYVDRLRGLAVLGMFAVHSPHPWLLPEVNRGFFATAVSNISGTIAPVFIFLAGVALALSAKRARAAGGIGAARIRIALRGLEILAAAYALQLVFWALAGFTGDWTRVLRVDVLNCIGAMVVLAAAVMWPTERFNRRALIVFLMLVLGAQVTWRAGLFEILPGGLAGYLAWAPRKAPFPLFPYGAWLPLGLIVGQAWAAVTDDARLERRFWIALAAAGIAALVAGYLLRAAPGFRAWDRLGLDPAPIRTTVNHFIHKAGLTFMLFVAARLSTAALDRFPFPALTLWGRTSLFAYCAHLLLVHYAFGPFWRRSLVIWQWALGVAALAAVMYGLCLAWDRLRPASPLGRLAARVRAGG